MFMEVIIVLSSISARAFWYLIIFLHIHVRFFILKLHASSGLKLKDNVLIFFFFYFLTKGNLSYSKCFVSFMFLHI